MGEDHERQIYKQKFVLLLRSWGIYLVLYKVILKSSKMLLISLIVSSRVLVIQDLASLRIGLIR